MRHRPDKAGAGRVFAICEDCIGGQCEGGVGDEDGGLMHPKPGGDS